MTTLIDNHHLRIVPILNRVPLHIGLATWGKRVEWDSKGFRHVVEQRVYFLDLGSLLLEVAFLCPCFPEPM